MMLPSWTLAAVGAAVIVHLSTAFICDPNLPETTTDDPIQVLVAHLGADGCGEVPAIWSWVIFMIGTFPLMLLLYGMIAPLLVGLLANSVAGSLAAVTGIGAVFAFIGFVVS